jgi:ATP-dependent DNA helicase DinG
MSPVGPLLHADGALARALDRYEDRPQQRAMAGAVEIALEDRRPLLCEAGTGTGKTLAYLLPAALSGLRVVISTGTRALQEQLTRKDIPLAARA